MKTTLDIYDNNILELPLVVGIAVPLEQLKKDYTYTDDTELDSALTNPAGSCCILKNIKTGTVVVFVGINNIPDYIKKDTKFKQVCWVINTIGHECYHAFMDSMSIINETPSTDHQELAAYYMGWLVECMYKTWFKSTTKHKENAE